MISTRVKIGCIRSIDASKEVDALPPDSGDPRASVKELGGTGRAHDGEISRRIVRASPRPVFLAGGLNPGNVRDAIHRVRPHGVDVCTGIRSCGDLDEDEVRRFIARAKGNC